jgi:hypothetical protein
MPQKSLLNNTRGVSKSCADAHAKYLGADRLEPRMSFGRLVELMLVDWQK